MASYPQRSREDLELDRLQFELFARRVLLALAVALCATTIYCAVRHSTWPAIGSGISVAVLGRLAVQGAGSSADDGAGQAAGGVARRRR
jgi:hypothetical protein